MTLIHKTTQKPKLEPLIGDQLIWRGSKNGNYTTKEGYNLLKEINLVVLVYPEIKKQAWKKLGKWNDLIPRVKLFLWRAIYDDLATANELHRRMPTIDPRCTRCSIENEFLTHLLFFSAVSKVTWFASHLSLWVDGIPLDFAQALLQVTTHLQPPQITTFCNIMWTLLKAKNEEVP